jgi:hypothetical protein
MELVDFCSMKSYPLIMETISHKILIKNKPIKPLSDFLTLILISKSMCKNLTQSKKIAKNHIHDAFSVIK